MPWNTLVIANANRRGINDGNTITFSFNPFKKYRQWHATTRHQLNESIIAGQI
jgi:hypothetical protein